MSSERKALLAGVADTLIASANNPVSCGGIEGLRHVMRAQAKRLRDDHQAEPPPELLAAAVSLASRMVSRRHPGSYNHISDKDAKTLFDAVLLMDRLLQADNAGPVYQGGSGASYPALEAAKAAGEDSVIGPFTLGSNAPIGVTIATPVASTAKVGDSVAFVCGACGAAHREVPPVFFRECLPQVQAQAANRPTLKPLTDLAATDDDDDPGCDVCHEPLADDCGCQNEYSREHDSYGAER